MLIDTPEQIAVFRARTLLMALKLEIRGMKRRGRSVYSIIKHEYGFTGSKQTVYNKLESFIDGAS